VYFNINFNVFFKIKKVHLLASELYLYQNARCNNKKMRKELGLAKISALKILITYLLHGVESFLRS